MEIKKKIVYFLLEDGKVGNLKYESILLVITFSRSATIEKWKWVFGNETKQGLVFGRKNSYVVFWTTPPTKL